MLWQEMEGPLVAASMLFYSCMMLAWVAFDEPNTIILSILLVNTALTALVMMKVAYDYGFYASSCYRMCVVVPTLVVDEEEISDDIECAICLENEPSHRLRCGHLFHKTCVVRLVSHGHDSCPLCRNKLV